MKLVMLLGPHAVGKMTVGQELAKITGFPLLHNHMTIELVSVFFDAFTTPEGRRLNELFRRELLEAVAHSDLPGLIYTAMIAFDQPSNLEYFHSVIELFEANGAQIYVVELQADYDVRLERNKTQNRLLHKPTKRDLQRSEWIFHKLESEHRLNTMDGESVYKNYLKLDNTHVPPQEAAAQIKEAFGL